MPIAAVFLREELCKGEEGQRLLEADCGLLARAYGACIGRVFVVRSSDPFPHTLDEVLGTGINMLITPSLEHIDHRSADVTARADLLVCQGNKRYRRDYLTPAFMKPRSPEPIRQGGSRASQG